MELRYYQKEAVQKTLDWFYEGKSRPLIVLPTATGKSCVQAALIRTILLADNYVRVLCLCHSKELVKQNHDEILALWPACPAGIWSSGLRRRDNTQVLFAGIQTVWNKAAKIGHADLIIIDEAHAIGPKGESRYGKFFKDIKAINPKVEIIGMSATPYRLDSGKLVPKTFFGISYEYSVLQALKDGFLCEVVSAPVETALRTEGVGRRGGEFIAGELEAAVNLDHLTKLACDEMVALAADRKSWIVFAAGVSHAQGITKRLREIGVDAECVTGETPHQDRDDMIKRHKSGDLRCLVNNNILTTGYNNPMLDMIACMRPTQSKGLWVQMVGRGMRLFSGKENCLLLDFARNLSRHGPIDKIRGDDVAEGKDGEAPTKRCPSCGAAVHAAARDCPECGFIFPESSGPAISAKASVDPVFSNQKAQPLEATVIGMTMKKYHKVGAEFPCLEVSYKTLAGVYKEFVFIEHPAGSYPRGKAEKWLREMGVDPMIRSVESVTSLNVGAPKKIEITKDGKYFKVTKKYFDHIDT